jgi:5-methylthioadenosine/S-adenosylhomocysteine deaminase
MWQTAMRGYGADWTLTQYFVWNYLQWGKSFRPQDIYAGNLLSAIEAIDAGVTTTVDWSHNLQTVEHAEAATDALQEVPGRFVLAYGNIQAAPWEWSAAPEFRDFVGRRFGGGNDMLGFQMAFDVPPASPDFPEKAAFEVARDLGVPVTTHAGVWKVTTARLLPPDRRDRRVRFAVHRERAERRPGLPAHLEAAPARHRRFAVDGHQRLVER